MAVEVLGRDTRAEDAIRGVLMDLGSLRVADGRQMATFSWLKLFWTLGVFTPRAVPT